MDRILPALVATFSIAKIPIMVIVLQEMILTIWKKNKLAQGSRSCRAMLRFWISILAIALATVARRSLGEFLGFVGGFCSMASSLLLPALFLALVSWNKRSWCGKLGLVLFLGLGCLFMASVTFYNFRKLVHNFKL